MLVHVLTYSQDIGNFQKNKHTFSEGHLELPYGPGFMSHKNIWLVYAHSVLRTLNQLPLTVENDQVTCKCVHFQGIS